MAKRTVKIGISARLYHPQPESVGLLGKTLQYLEQSVAHWVMSRDVLVFMVPSIVQDSPMQRSNMRLADYVGALDGLVLQGGTDLSPLSYGEEPLKPEWAGDRVRDAYEMELLHEFMEAGKPVLGICRGLQLINVALGGSLHQDIPSLVEDAIAHEAPEYDRHTHPVQFAGGGPAGQALPGADGRPGGFHPPPGGQGAGQGPDGGSHRRRRPGGSRALDRSVLCGGPAMAPGIPHPGQGRTAGRGAAAAGVSGRSKKAAVVAGCYRSSADVANIGTRMVMTVKSGSANRRWSAPLSQLQCGTFATTSRRFRALTGRAVRSSLLRSYPFLPLRSKRLNSFLPIRHGPRSDDMSLERK